MWHTLHWRDRELGPKTLHIRDLLPQVLPVPNLRFLGQRAQSGYRGLEGQWRYLGFGLPHLQGQSDPRTHRRPGHRHPPGTGGFTPDSRRSVADTVEEPSAFYWTVATDADLEGRILAAKLVLEDELLTPLGGFLPPDGPGPVDQEDLVRRLEQRIATTPPVNTNCSPT